MADIRVHVSPGNLVSRKVDDQHISRITTVEATDSIAQMLVFSKPIRERVKHWLRDGREVETAGKFLGADRDKVAVVLAGK